MLGRDRGRSRVRWWHQWLPFLLAHDRHPVGALESPGNAGEYPSDALVVTPIEQHLLSNHGLQDIQRHGLDKWPDLLLQGCSSKRPGHGCNLDGGEYHSRVTGHSTKSPCNTQCQADRAHVGPAGKQWRFADHELRDLPKHLVRLRGA